MHHFQRISASVQTIKAQLFPHERIVQEREGVGLYDGKERSAVFDDGKLYLTSHRIIYIDSTEPLRNSRFLDLKQVKQTEHWVGFMKSSAKITLVLHETVTETSTGEAEYDADDSALAASESWTCSVCGYRNNGFSGIKCTLCGVNRSNSVTPAGSGKPSRQGTPSHSAASSRPDSPAARTSSERAFISCPACTYLNHPSMQRCEICDTVLGSFSVRRASTPAAGHPAVDAATSSSTPTFVKLSFRKGGDKAFYTALKGILQAKEWDNGRLLNRKIAPGQDGKAHTLATYGINGILRTIDIDARDREDDMQEALGDLEALKKRAQDMVRIAEVFNRKLAAASGNNDEDVANRITRSLRSIGLESPVVAGAENAEDSDYYRRLAKELGTVLLGSSNSSENKAQSIMTEGDPERELMGLDEVWCLWNRARGVALVSPEDMHHAVEYLSEVTQPQIKLLVFRSGLNVLHLPAFSPEAFTKRVRHSLRQADDQVSFGLTTLEIARQEQISVILTMQMLQHLEDGESPPIVRDEGDLRAGVRWQLNLFDEFERMTST